MFRRVKKELESNLTSLVTLKPIYELVCNLERIPTKDDPLDWVWTVDKKMIWMSLAIIEKSVPLRYKNTMVLIQELKDVLHSSNLAITASAIPCAPNSVEDYIRSGVTESLGNSTDDDTGSSIAIHGLDVNSHCKRTP